MSVLHLAAKFGQLKVIDMLWGKTPIDQVSVKVWINAYFSTVNSISKLICYGRNK